ncbi:anaphase promoting complex subunit 8 [Scheffersomyces xylosifermentans]|uniref:anaphase promoting complex subunit 8 n=1 Tax=Scheffersomyces xylosifermentans TaxID=1304137 RepID=UPI00315DDEBA
MTDKDQVDRLRSDLLRAYYTLSDINLFQAAKWCAEALNGLPEQKESSEDYPDELPHGSIGDDDPRVDQNKFLLAKTYFNCKEFDRAAHVLKSCKSGNALFLRLYSILISVDKRATEQTDGSINIGSVNELTDQQDVSPNNSKEVVNDLNSRLSKIIQESENYLSKNDKGNAFLYYLNGVIYNKKKKYQLAQSNLYNSLKLFPYNWSAWQELIASLNTFEEAITFISKIKAAKSSLSSNIMFQFFEVVVLQEFYQQSASLFDSLNTLISIFPTFTFLKVQQFLIAYHSLDYFQAEATFDQILVDDPLRLDDLDTYSNMLYVMEKRPKLSFLAQFASMIDKFRPETCCVIANYHSMKCEHEKAIMYYKRALMLNKNCLSAWTLMGHEFVELKNSHAAIESYRRAVDTNPKDFRAWYGLGQAYEVLDMHLYALYYYQRATNLQPLDKRMWQAIGNCYEKIDKLEEAMKSFEKALSIDNYANDDGEGVVGVEPHICYRLATVSEKLGNSKDTYKYMKLCFEQEFEWGITDETSKARLWLARNSLENRRFEEAYELAKDLTHSNAHDIEEARSIAREARNRTSK